MSSQQDLHDSFRAVVFDWAGTVLDFGSCAPMGALQQLFARHGIEIDIDEARAPMGLPKWDHIRAIGTTPRVAAKWHELNDRAFGDSDVDELYAEFTPMNAASVAAHAALIPGALDVVQALRAQGLKIGSTTGYNRPIMNVLAPLAAQQGYVPDNLVCAGDVAVGRPSPLMMYRTFADLGVWPANAVVKVDDTPPGIAEARAAGCWAIGVSVSGNEVGLTAEQWQSLQPEVQGLLRERATRRLREAGAHEVIDSVADLLPALERLRVRAVQGEQPTA
jgi:phosphonoacetaldehyde hydrolase